MSEAGSPVNSPTGQTPKLDVALVHWPCVDRAGNMIATNVTNFDIHDIARSSRVYGVENYYIVNRMREQLMFVERVLDHWRVGRGMELNPMRGTALGMVKTAETVADVVKTYQETHGKKPLLVATAARDLSLAPGIGFSELKQRMWQEPDQPVVLVFGTGFGLHEDLLKECDLILEPIKGASADDYRHLSVRSAVSICLDRLMSKW